MALTKRTRTPDLATIAARIKKRDVSPVDIARTCLDRIEEINPRVNAFITVLGDRALDAAREAEAEIEAGRWRGPLHGIPVAVKDFYDTAGARTTAAFKHFKNRIPKKDAVAVTALKTAGAILIGKTNMHTLGMGTTSLESYFGPVANPWNPDYIAGGSSGGSAAAVASGMCFATVDTDAIGSCRLPAACCGVVGFKPSYGAISTRGILAGEQPPDEMIQWLSHGAITARTVTDVAIVYDALARRKKQRRSYAKELSKKRRLRVATATNFDATSDVRKAFSSVLRRIARSGVHLTDAAAPLYDPRSGIKNIKRDRRTISDAAFSEIDVLLLPTTSTAVPSIAEARGNEQALSPANTAFANYFGLPAISIPCGVDANGLPLGLQIVGRPDDDLTVLQFAFACEKVFSRRTGRPRSRRRRA